MSLHALEEGHKEDKYDKKKQAYECTEEYLVISGQFIVVTDYGVGCSMLELFENVIV